LKDTKWIDILAHFSIGCVICDGSIILKMNEVAIQIFGQKEIFAARIFNDETQKILGESQTIEVEIGEGFYKVSVSTEEIDGRCFQVYCFQDVTGERKARERLKLYEAYMDSFIDVGILAIDENENITYANQASCIHDGFHQGEIIGMKFRDFSPEVTNSAILETFQSRKPVENRQMEHNIPNVAREIGSAYPVYLDGEFKGAVAILLFNRWINNLLNVTSALQIEYRDKAKAKVNQGYVFDDILGQDREILKVKKLAMRVCNVPSSVLIYGETGTGKELFAQSIHNASTRYDKPFIGVNCAAIPETLLESTLFGTERGAFTGAVTSAGLIEQAGDGTLFLDEINSMPVELQVKLLRVIQERAYRRVGGTQIRHLECRILSACNRSPKECIAVGVMRDDLYYRLAAVQLNIPPLRERGADILLLAENAMKHFSEVYGIKPVLSKEVKMAFLNYNWPGNVRELNHVIESTMILLENEHEITLNDLPDVIRLCATLHYSSVDLEDVMGGVGQTEENRREEADTGESELKSSLADYERNNIILALQRNGYNISKTARELGYSRSNLQYRIKKLDIEIRKKQQ